MFVKGHEQFSLDPRLGLLVFGPLQEVDRKSKYTRQTNINLSHSHARLKLLVKNSTSGVNRTKISSEELGPCLLLTRTLQFAIFHIDLFEFLQNFDYPCNTVDLI